MITKVAFFTITKIEFIAEEAFRSSHPEIDFFLLVIRCIAPIAQRELAILRDPTTSFSVLKPKD